jgi:hypothetical protein
MVLERKVAFINLTDDSIEINPVPLSLRKKFLGARGIRTSLKNSAARTGLGAVMGSKNLSKEINGAPRASPWYHSRRPFGANIPHQRTNSPTGKLRGPLGAGIDIYGITSGQSAVLSKAYLLWMKQPIIAIFAAETLNV